MPLRWTVQVHPRLLLFIICCNNTCAALFKVLLATTFCNEAYFRNKAALREVNQGTVYKIEVDLRSVVLNLVYIHVLYHWEEHGGVVTEFTRHCCHTKTFLKRKVIIIIIIFQIIIIIVVITHVVILGTIKNGDINLVKIAAGVFEGNSHVPRHPLTL